MTPGERLDTRPAPQTETGGLWRRFRAPLLAALPSGAVAGGLTAVVLQLDGLDAAPDASSTAAMALLLAAAGALVAAVAALGAVAAVLVAHRHLAEPGVTGYGTVALGAGLAVGVAVLLVATAGGGAWTTSVLIAALGAAALSAAAAAVVTALALRWARRR